MPAPAPEDPYLEVFETKPPEEAVGTERKTFYRLDLDSEKEKKRQKNLKRKAVKKSQKSKRNAEEDAEMDGMFVGN